MLTNVITESDPVGPKVIARLAQLAQRRHSTYVPVLLSCERTELLRRVPQPDRATKLKWIDPTAVAAFVDRSEPPDATHGRPVPQNRSGQITGRAMAAVVSAGRRKDSPAAARWIQAENWQT